MWVLEWNPGPLEVQPVLLNTEPTLQLVTAFFGSKTAFLVTSSENMQMSHFCLIGGEV